MNKFFRLLFFIIILLIFVVSSLNIIYADGLFRAPIVGKFTITNGPGEGMHKGVSENAIDISTSGEKVDIYAVGDGVVEIAGTMIKNEEDKVMTVPYDSNLKGLEIVGFGNYIIIAHKDNYKSLYAHLSDINVKKDEAVSKGKKIAVSGNTGLSLGVTGMHLHFEIRKDDKSVDLIGLLENFTIDNFNQVYWDWRDGKTTIPLKEASGDITGSPVETSTSNQTITQESKSEKNVSFIDNIVNFFKKIGEFFASVFSYKSPSYARAAEKEEKIVEDEYQIIGKTLQDPVSYIDKIAYTSDNEAVIPSICLINEDGTGKKLFKENAYNPAWSPDGKWIAYVQHVDDEEEKVLSISREIRISSIDGLEDMKVLEVGLTEGGFLSPWLLTWSHDGEGIFFQITPWWSEISNGPVLYLDLSTLLIKELDIPYYEGAWNRSYDIRKSDGKIVYIKEQLEGIENLRNLGDYQVYEKYRCKSWIMAMDKDSKNQELLFGPIERVLAVENYGHSVYFPPSYQNLSAPRWSPDGNKIAFLISKYEIEESDGFSVTIPIENLWKEDILALIDINDSKSNNFKILYNSNESYITDIVWSPDGNKIAIESERRFI